MEILGPTLLVQYPVFSAEVVNGSRFWQKQNPPLSCMKLTGWS